MLARYKSIFERPGAAAFCAAAFVMRMPIAMYPLGIILIISARDGKYGFAGVLSACYVFGGAVGMPALSVLVDRFGQRRVLLPSGVVHAAAVIALAAMLRSGAPNWLLVVPTVVFGFSYLSVGSLVRARWSHLLDGRPELGTALSAESVLDELIFVVGPLLATVIATQATPDLVLYLAVALVVGGTLWLAALRATEPPPHPRGDDPHPSALREPGVAVLTLATVAMGAVFASAEVAMVAFCGQHGERPLSGLVLACMAGGSAVSGLLYGAVDWRAGVLARFRTQALIFAVLPVVLLAAFAVPVLAVCAFVLGLGIAPTLINAFGLVQQIVPVRALTEGLSWINTGLGVGYGAGAALVGGIAARHGARTAFLVVIGSALLTGLLALAVRARPDRAPRPGVVVSP